MVSRRLKLQIESTEFVTVVVRGISKPKDMLSNIINGIKGR